MTARTRAEAGADGRRRDLRRPEPPEPLPSPVVDNHTHLDIADGDEPLDVERGLAMAAAAGVPRAVQVGCDLASARWTLQAVERWPQLVGAVALHPNDAARLVAEAVSQGSGRDRGEAGGRALSEAVQEITRLAGHPRIRAVGESGLDYFRTTDAAGRAAQVESFRRHIRLANDLGVALQIHDRQADADVLRVLAEEGAPRRTVFHCFSGDAALAARCAERGWYLSFAGTVTFKNAEPLRDALRVTPLDRLLVETDAPFLAPVPHRGRPNASYLLPLTARVMASTKGVALQQLCQAVSANAEAVYGAW